MFKDNIAMLRVLNGYSQEEVAAHVGISRQAYAKWERGDSLPDIERCQRLAALYGTTIDALMADEEKIGAAVVTPAPRGKHIFGTVKMNDHGQVVIPKKARTLFELSSGSELVVLGDEKEGLALVRADVFEKRLQNAWESAIHKESAD